MIRQAFLAAALAASFADAMAAPESKASPSTPPPVTPVATGAATVTAPAVAPPVATDGIDIADVRYPRFVELAGKRIRLNGAGVRYKAIFKVYTAGLYLDAPVSRVEDVIANTGPRRMRIVMLRSIDSNELGKLFIRGMEDNATREEFVKAIPGTIHLGEIFSEHKRLAAGDEFTVDWIPGQGTQIVVNGKQLGRTIAAPEFYNALMKIWLGRAPADHLLKDALLAQERPA